jgi:hypothetical protein
LHLHCQNPNPVDPKLSKVICENQNSHEDSK